MNDGRKQIIMKEIYYWKENNLLPETYCDFLLALYSQGELSETVESASGNKWKSFLMLVDVLLLPLAFLTIYFTELQMIMQISILILFVALSVILYVYFKRKQSFGLDFSLEISLLLLFITSIQLVQFTFQNSLYIHILTCMHCIVWIWLGKKLKRKYLFYSGIIGVIILVYIIIY
ncbi:hypothetical protein [Radiobacillus deserti]|uniref:Uncharacterized protein n=1 Tax=Radiobacillus deserti TaxID=2594883 RepID=A0A516KGV9_9BACI|nr:hypothetical protein [Radiobacillus deserti]QDP40632.1 hypothetical protein FN924_10820 [Radiobacillus deserti]